MQEFKSRGDDILARCEDLAQRIGIATLLHIEHAVGIEFEDRLKAVGRNHAGVGSSAERASVLADLVRRMHPKAHELHLRMVQNSSHCSRSGPASSPLND